VLIAAPAPSLQEAVTRSSDPAETRKENWKIKYLKQIKNYEIGTLQTNMNSK